MKSIELVCINYGDFGDAAKVADYSWKSFDRIKKVTIFHPRAPESFSVFGLLNFIKCKSPSQHLCCLKEMPQYLTCDYALSIQWDGFIVRPDLWDERFLDYDYIACPWPLQNIKNPDHRVGSGGFCLFSKRLAQFWAEHGDENIPNDWERGAVNRKKYEDAGFTFAPLELAMKFGEEIVLDDQPRVESFGFHAFQYGDHEKYRKLVYG